MKNTASDLVTYAFIVAGILVLTRPGSQGPKLFGNLTSGFTSIVQGVTGQRVTQKGA